MQTFRSVETPDRYNRGVVVMEFSGLDPEGNQITIVQDFSRNFNVEVVAHNRQFGYFPRHVKQEFCVECGEPGRHGGLNYELKMCQDCYYAYGEYLSEYQMKAVDGGL